MVFVALMLCLLLASCGGGSSSPPGPSPPSNPNTITITAAGVSPKELTVQPGTRVLFVNSDNRRHEMTSDPHPEHTDCTEINSVGALSRGKAARPETSWTFVPAGSTITANLTIPA